MHVLHLRPLPGLLQYVRYSWPAVRRGTFLKMMSATVAPTRVTLAAVANPANSRGCRTRRRRRAALRETRARKGGKRD